MAIIKTSKNMILKSINKETIVCGGKVLEISQKKWMEATDGKLILSSPKKIVSNGDKQ